MVAGKFHSKESDATCNVWALRYNRNAYVLQISTRSLSMFSRATHRSMHGTESNASEWSAVITTESSRHQRHLSVQIMGCATQN